MTTRGRHRGGARARESRGAHLETLRERAVAREVRLEPRGLLDVVALRVLRGLAAAAAAAAAIYRGGGGGRDGDGARQRCDRGERSSARWIDAGGSNRAIEFLLPIPPRCCVEREREIIEPIARSREETLGLRAARWTSVETHPGGTKKYAKPPTSDVAGRPIAPTRRRFMTLRLPMSGTSPTAPDARTTERDVALGAAVALRESPRTLHPSFALGMLRELGAVMEAMLNSPCVRR